MISDQIMVRRETEKEIGTDQIRIRNEKKLISSRSECGNGGLIGS